MSISFAFKHCRLSSYFPIYFLIFANFAFLLKCVLEKILSGAFLIHNKIMGCASGAYFCFFSVRLHFFLILLHFEFTSFAWLSDWFCMFSVLFNISRFLFFAFFSFCFICFAYFSWHGSVPRESDGKFWELSWSFKLTVSFAIRIFHVQKYVWL